MIPSIFMPIPLLTRDAKLLVVMFTTLLAIFAMRQAVAAEPHTAPTGPTAYSMVPQSSTDHFVSGKYDKNGNYIPPHYVSASKPSSHGYFYKKKKPDGKN